MLRFWCCYSLQQFGSRQCSTTLVQSSDNENIRAPEDTIGSAIMTTSTITDTAELVTNLLDRAARRERLAPEEWAHIINEAPDEELRRRADDLRRELHPDNVVTYVVD